VSLRRRPIVVAAAVVVVVFTTLGLAEVALRVSHRLNPSFIFPDSSYNRFRGRPFADDYDFKLNSRGFKDVERRTEKPPGVYRVLAIGDSFVFGVVPHQHTFVTVLERLVNDHAAAGRRAPIEVVNMGVPGTGPREYLALLVDEGLAYSPDLVMVCVFVGNDLIRVKKAAYEHAYVASLVRFLFQARHFKGMIPHGAAVYRDDDATFSSAKHLEIVAARSGVYVRDGRRLQRDLPDALASLSQIRDICRQRRIDLLVVVIPDEVQVDPGLQEQVARRLRQRPADMDFGAPNEMLSRELGQRGIRSLDLLPAFRNSSAARLYKPRDSHWNIAGNRLAAEAIAPEIARYLR
jgi:hypothetical protein